MRAFILILLLLSGSAFAETPKLTARVNDYAAVLTVAERASLETKLEAIERSEGNPQVAVLFPKDMGGADIERFTNDTFRAWKLGQAGKDNGVLIVIAPKERKWRIEVGYGLEGAIPDGRAKAIIAQGLDPHLKGGKTAFYSAVDAALVMIAQDLSKERAATTGAAEPKQESPSILSFTIFFGLAAAFGFFIWAVVTPARRPQRYPGLSDSPMRRRSEDDSALLGAAATGAIIGGGVGAGIGAATLASRRPPVKSYSPPPKPSSAPARSSSSSSSSSDFGSSSSWSGSSDSGSSSFSGGGGDSGGGGASGGD